MNNETVNTNVRNNSTANFEFTIGEVEFKGITLKNLKMSACADITDENMRISTDGAVGLFKALMSFADTKIDRLIDHSVESDNKRIEIQKLEAEASAKESGPERPSTMLNQSIGMQNGMRFSKNIPPPPTKTTNKLFFDTELGSPLTLYFFFVVYIQPTYARSVQLQKVLHV